VPEVEPMTPSLARIASRPGSTQVMHVGIDRIAGGVVWLDRGGAHAVLDVRATSGAPRVPAAQEAAVMSLGVFLNALDYPIQFLARSYPVDLGGYAARFECAAAQLGDDPLAEIAWDHAALARRLTRGQTLVQHCCFVAVSDAEGSPARVDASSRLSRLWPLAKGRRDQSDREQHASHTLTARCEEIARGLARCDVSAQRLDDDALRDLLYEAWCPELARTQPLPRGSAGRTP